MIKEIQTELMWQMFEGTISDTEYNDALRLISKIEPENAQTYNANENV